jgi:hypothetical protein
MFLRPRWAEIRAQELKTPLPDSASARASLSGVPPSSILDGVGKNGKLIDLLNDKDNPGELRGVEIEGLNPRTRLPNTATEHGYRYELTTFSNATHGVVFAGIGDFVWPAPMTHTIRKKSIPD